MKTPPLAVAIAALCSTSLPGSPPTPNPEYDPTLSEEGVVVGISYSAPDVPRSDAGQKMTLQLASIFNEGLCSPGQSAGDLKMERWNPYRPAQYEVPATPSQQR